MLSLGSLFKRQPSAMVGLDVSTSSVKLVELGRNKAGDLVLERCAMELLPRGAIVEGNIEKFEEVVDAIRRVIKKCGTRTKNGSTPQPAQGSSAVESVSSTPQYRPRGGPVP